MRLHKNAKVELIRHVPLFANCSKKELRKIASIADEIDFRAGKVLIQEGKPGREFFVLVEGKVDISRKGTTIDTCEAGDFFGEVALLSDAPRNATITATTPIVVLVLTDRNFRTLLAATPEIQRKVLTALADRLAPQTV
jgi:CRP-like cAMP-binding protein